MRIFIITKAKVYAYALGGLGGKSVEEICYAVVPLRRCAVKPLFIRINMHAFHRPS